MKILLTAYAKGQLKEIVRYYKQVASLRVAKRIKSDIFNAIRNLPEHPEMGVVDEFLADQKKGHRKVVQGHHKIIYRIEGRVIYITDIFDSRQDPKKVHP